MPDLGASLPAFLMACLLIEATPGPNMGWLAVLTVQRGRTAGFAAVGGVSLGLIALALACALGLEQVLALHPVLRPLLGWAGVAFMVYLSFEAWRDAVGAGRGPSAAPPANAFLRGFLVNALNPKAAAVFVTLVPDFAGPPGGAAKLTTYSLAYVAVATLVHAAIVTFADRFGRQGNNPERARRVGQACAILLLAVATWMAWKLF